MSLLRISNASRKYISENGNEHFALKNVSIIFPNTGLVAIVGKSGSGKSTIINLISLLDKPTSGCVYYRDEETSKWNQKKQDKYHNNEIGIIFQHYHLLENETALFNVMLPMLIKGKKPKDAERDAINLFQSINITDNIYRTKCKDLSGGEKERVAVLRAIANDPPIVLADEPTGALDSKNSIIVMDILKKLSETKLVIMVSHNMDLVDKYADEIYTIKDGELDNVVVRNKNESHNETVLEDKHHKKDDWIMRLMKSNFKRRFKRNIVSCLALTIGLVSSMLIIGFVNGNSSSIKKRSEKQFDYGVSTFYRENSQSIPGSKINLVQMIRPSIQEINNFSNKLEDFHIEPNADALIPLYPLMKIGDETIEDVAYQPIYSFVDSSADPSILLEGEIPIEDTLNEVLINKTAYNNLKKKTNSNPIGLSINLHSDYEYHHYLGDELETVITDYFVYDKTITIVGVVDDFNFLATAKVYYSFSALKEYLLEYPLNNLSTQLEKDITWYDQLNNCADNDSLSSYSYRLFLKDYSQKELLNDVINNIQSPYRIESSSITITNTLFDLIGAASLGMELFLAIALIGTALILGIVSFSSYSEDKKSSAILSCIGASKSEIFSLYLYENIGIGLISLIISIICAPLLSVLINKIIFQFSSFENMISIPFLTFMGYRFLLPLILFIGTTLICVVATYIPLFFAKKISLKEELADE